MKRLFLSIALLHAIGYAQVNIAGGAGIGTDSKPVVHVGIGYSWRFLEANAEVRPSPFFAAEKHKYIGYRAGVKFLGDNDVNMSLGAGRYTDILVQAKNVKNKSYWATYAKVNYFPSHNFAFVFDVLYLNNMAQFTGGVQIEIE